MLLQYLEINVIYPLEKTKNKIFFMVSADSTFLSFCQRPPDICSLREHAGVEESFKIVNKKRFDNSFRVNKALRGLYT
jgi:hypothetical protein